jgi:hypothetical protein
MDDVKVPKRKKTYLLKQRKKELNSYPYQKLI